MKNPCDKVSYVHHRWNMNILDANVLVNKTKKLNINCGSVALSLAKRKFLFIQSCDGLKKMLRNRF